MHSSGAALNNKNTSMQRHTTLKTYEIIYKNRYYSTLGFIASQPIKAHMSFSVQYKLILLLMNYLFMLPRASRYLGAYAILCMQF